MKKNKKPIIIAIIIIAVLIYNFRDYFKERMNKGVIVASGNVEVTEANIGFKIAGRISELLVNEGQKVNKGDVLARLDDTELKSIVRQNQAALGMALARLELLQAGSRPQEMRQAQLNVKSAQALLLQAEAKLEEIRKGARPQEIEQVQQEVKAAEAARSEMQAKLEELKSGSRPQEIEQIQANLQAARIDLDKAKKDFERAETLYKNGAISASRYEADKSLYESRLSQYKNTAEKLSLSKEGARKEEIEAAEQRLRQAQAGLSGAKEKLSLIKEGARSEEVKAQEQVLAQTRAAYDRAKEELSLVNEGPRKEEIKVAEQGVEQARAALFTSEERLKDTVLVAPATAVVLRKNGELGETVSPGVAVFTLGDLESPWVKIYVKETKLGQVKLGSRAEIRTDSFPGKVYEGVITYISSEAEFTPKNIQTKEERIKLVFGVKVSVKNINQELKPGLPADVKIIL